MTSPQELNPDYDPATWTAGYQARQFGVAGNDGVEEMSAYGGLATPPEAMADAIIVESDWQEDRH